jgi:hypothetical protein
MYGAAVEARVFLLLMEAVKQEAAPQEVRRAVLPEIRGTLPGAVRMSLESGHLPRLPVVPR